MTTRKRFILYVATLSLAAAVPAFSQDPPPQDPPSNGGWRRFGDRPADQRSMDQQRPMDQDQRPMDQRPMDQRTMDQRTMDQRPMNQRPMDQRADGRDDGRPFDAPPPPPQLSLPAGSWITVRVNQPLSSDHNQPGDPFTATLAQPLVANGYVIARRGQTIAGRVAEAQKAGHVKGTSRLGLQLTELSLVDGQQVPLRTQLVDRKGDTSVGRDVGAVGATTGIGAAVGAAADGGFGAGMGAIAGAGASIIGVLATRGRATVVYPETELTFRLEAPIAVSTDRAAQAFQPVGQQDYEQHNLDRRGPPRLARGPAPYYGGYGYPYYGGGYGYPYYGAYSPYFYGPSLFFHSGPRFYGGRGFYRR